MEKGVVPNCQANVCSAGKRDFDLGCYTFRGKLANRTIFRNRGVWLLVAPWSLLQADTVKISQRFERN